MKPGKVLCYRTRLLHYGCTTRLLTPGSWIGLVKEVITSMFHFTDMIAIPDFAAGAMENWGLITYRETALLFKPGASSESNKKRVASVISHELAHQVNCWIIKHEECDGFKNISIALTCRHVVFRRLMMRSIYLSIHPSIHLYIHLFQLTLSDRNVFKSPQDKTKR